MQVYRAYPDVVLWNESPEAARTRTAEYHYLAPASNCSPFRRSRWPTCRSACTVFYLRPGFVVRHLARYWRYYLYSLFRAPLVLGRALGYPCARPVGGLHNDRNVIME